MKILQVFSFFSLPRGGGTVERIYKLSRALIKRGHEVALYTSNYDLDCDYINSSKGLKVYPFHSMCNLPGLHITPQLLLEARKNLRHFDIIHFHAQRSFQNIVLHHYSHKYRIPYVIDAHGSSPRLKKKVLKLVYDTLFGKKIIRDCCGFIADSELGVNEYKELGIEQKRITYITPAFPIEDFSALPEKEAFRKKYSIKHKHIVMFLGRIHWIKGIDYLINGFRELCDMRNDTLLIIVGADDGYKNTLLTQISQLELSDKVLFTGFLDGRAKLEALVAADIVVQTSRYEHHAWAPFEAVLCGTPIIVSSHTGAGQDVEKLNAGYTVTYNDSSELAETMNMILEYPDEAHEKTKQASQYIRDNLALDSRIIDYEQLYADCIRLHTL